jgi:hypothetical protein
MRSFVVLVVLFTTVLPVCGLFYDRKKQQVAEQGGLLATLDRQHLFTLGGLSARGQIGLYSFCSSVFVPVCGLHDRDRPHFLKMAGRAALLILLFCTTVIVPVLYDRNKQQGGFSPVVSEESSWSPQRRKRRRHKTWTMVLKLGAVKRRVFSTIRHVYQALLESILYQISVFLGAGVSMQLFALVLYSAMLVMLGGALLFLSSVSRSWADALFRAYALLHNAPGIDILEYKGIGLLLANSLFITGTLTFAVTVAMVSESIRTMMQHVWKGNNKIVESNHIVVLNWNGMIIPVIRQTMAGYANNKSRMPKIVILADQNLEMMRNLIYTNDDLGALSHHVVVRSGNPSSMRDLIKISVASAKHVLIFTPHADPESANSQWNFGTHKSQLTTQIACVKALQQMHAAARGARAPFSPRLSSLSSHSSLSSLSAATTGVVVASIEHAPDFLMGFTLFDPTSFQQHLLATAALQRGLTKVWSRYWTSRSKPLCYQLNLRATN